MMYLKTAMTSGVMSAMSAMVNLEIPWINIMSKMDLVTVNSDDPAGGRNGIRTKKDIARWSTLLPLPLLMIEEFFLLSLSRYLDPDPLLLSTAHGGNKRSEDKIHNPRFHALNQALVQLVGQRYFQGPRLIGQTLHRSKITPSYPSCRWTSHNQTRSRLSSATLIIRCSTAKTRSLRSLGI